MLFSVPCSTCLYNSPEVVPAGRAEFPLWVHKGIGESHQLTKVALSGVPVARWLYTELHFTSKHCNILVYSIALRSEHSDRLCLPYMAAQNYCYGALCCVLIERDN